MCYFITVMENIPGSGKIGDRRTVGYFESFIDATWALNKNLGDMHETIYDYAVVEEFEPGLYPVRCFDHRKLFEYDYGKNGYFEIKEPECAKRIGNFANIG